jgi:hypothetical protein
LAGVVCVVGTSRARGDAAPQDEPEGSERQESRYLAQATPTPEPTDQSTVARPTRATTMEQVAESAMQEIHLGGTKARYSLNFFGDTSFGFADPATRDFGFPSFSLGVQDFLIRGELGKHMVATTEFAFEVGDEGVVVDVERMHVRWQMDNVYIEAGRVHTWFGYWNNAYHHGSWLQPMITRPRWVAFEDNDGLLPVHWVGIDMGAKIKVGTGALNFVASIGNGRGKIVDDVRNAHDYQAGKAVHLSVEYLGFVLPDLRLGLAGIYDRIPGQPVGVRPALPDAPIDEWIGSAYIAYPSVPLLLIAEAYLVSHRHADQEWTTYGGFGLLGYAFGPLTPYVEFERIASKGGTCGQPPTPCEDPFFVPDPAAGAASLDTTSFVAGLRLDLSDWTALKAEYRNTNALDRKLVTQQAIINWSWGF